MTGFYRNMQTGDYDEYRDTEEVSSHYHYSQYNSKKEKKKYNASQRRFTSEDLRPVGGDDYEY